MIFDAIRHNRPLKIAALFGFAAASATMGAPREAPEVTELRQLTRSFTENGSLSAQNFIRMTDLSQKMAQDPAARQILNNAGIICAHGTGSGTASSGLTAATCPVSRRRQAKGDMSHLLVFHHWV